MVGGLVNRMSTTSIFGCKRICPNALTAGKMSTGNKIVFLIQADIYS